MQVRHHPLQSPACGTQRQLQSVHYGQAGQGQKVYLQASLHADELPGMLVLHHLRQLLDAADVKGEVLGEVVVVPLANPIGLDQTVMHYQLGRFELASMSNFNRDFPDLFKGVLPWVEGRLTQDAASNTTIIRAAMQQVLDEMPLLTELTSQRQALLKLSADADVVIDLHCDYEAVMHAYVEEPYVDRLMPLAQYLGAQAVLTAKGSGDNVGFDEVLSSPWWKLSDHFAGRFPIQMACLSTTVELRGQRDVTHDLALQDAQGIYAYLQHLGVLAGTPPMPPAALCGPTPLSGTASVIAPHAGVLTFIKDVGDKLQAGDVVAQVIDPLTQQVSNLISPIAGIVYARHNLRFATRGMEACRVAGPVPYRSGNLLSP